MKSATLREIAALAFLAFFADAAAAQSYPNKPVRFIVPFGPGGPGDAVGRMIGRKLTETLGQPVVIDNRSGATTIIGTELVARSPPDGYTLLLISTTHAVNPSLFQKLPYDPIKDFAPVTMITYTPFMLVIHPSIAANSVPELVSLARSKPGQLNYGSSGNGSSIHLTTELFKTAAKIEMTHVPYKGSGPAFIDLIGGQVQVLFSSTVSSLPHVKSGKVRGLAITSPKRAAALPAVPTVAEFYPGFESSSWFGLLVPAKTPRPIIERLLADTRAALNSSDVSQSLISQGAEPAGNSPAEFGAYFDTEIKKWRSVIKAAGIKLEQ
ncbi:MAG: tripartite tricarboxylate transporter substrate binding protein [Burkholderiaceae bacterium]